MRPSLVIVGLGNPGKQYERTRHNAGFIAIDLLAETYGTGDWKQTGRFDGELCEARVGVAPVMLLKPHTYMNVSGQAVQKILSFYKLDPSAQLLVLSDEIDLPLGTIRYRDAGSAGTHNGLKSIVEVIGEAFPRIRIGIGPKPERADLATWVLSAFSEEEEASLRASIKDIPAKVESFIHEKHPN